MCGATERSLDEYDRMVTAGLLRGEHVELIRGELVAMSPIGSAHSALRSLTLAELLRDA